MKQILFFHFLQTLKFCRIWEVRFGANFEILTDFEQNISENAWKSEVYRIYEVCDIPQIIIISVYLNIIIFCENIWNDQILLVSK